MRIFVNGAEHEVDGETIGYAELCALSGHDPALSPSATYVTRRP